MRTLLLALAAFLIFGAPSCPSSGPAGGSPSEIKAVDPAPAPTQMNGGFDAGNPGNSGGFDAGNPAALRLLTGRLEAKKSDDGAVECSYDDVVLVDDELHHTAVPVDPANGCVWKKEVPASQPVAVVGVGENQVFSVSDLNKEVFQVPAPGEGPIDLGLLTYDLDAQSLVPQFPIAAKNLLAGSGADADGDGIDDEFDGLNDALLYGLYKPGTITGRAAACPKGHLSGIWIEIRPWTSAAEPGSVQINNVEMVFRPVGYDPESGAPSELKDILRGRLKAGFLEAVSPTASPIQCNGWITPQEPSGPLQLKVTCRAVKGAFGFCEYSDFVKP